MSFLLNYYCSLTIKFRLSLLCFCYSLCIIVVAFMFQSSSMLVKYGSMTLSIVLGGVFVWINIWSILTPIEKAIGFLETIAGGDLRVTIATTSNNELSKMLLRHQKPSGIHVPHHCRHSEHCCPSGLLFRKSFPPHHR